jgi:hypothetical protein
MPIKKIAHLGVILFDGELKCDCGGTLLDPQVVHDLDDWKVPILGRNQHRESLVSSSEVGGVADGYEKSHPNKEPAFGTCLDSKSNPADGRVGPGVH